MNKPSKIDVSVVIPVYNEEKIIVSQINKINKELNSRAEGFYEIIIVANGCTDSTIEKCSRLKDKRIKLRVLKTADYGLGLRNGMMAARGRIIINFDLDFYNIDFLLQAKALEPFGYDVIVASKNSKLSKDTRGFSRRIVSGIYKYVLYYGFGLEVSDTHGIKMWRNDSRLKRLIKETINNKEIFDTELIIRSQYRGRSLLELPIEVTEMRKSVSSILRRSLRGFIQITKLWVQLRIREKNAV